MPIWVVWLFYLSSNWRFLLHPKWLFLPGANRSNGGSSSGQTSKPSSKPSTGGNSGSSGGQTSKPSTGGSTSSGGSNQVGQPPASGGLGGLINADPQGNPDSFQNLESEGNAGINVN